MNNCFFKFCKYATTTAGGLFAFSQLFQMCSYNKICAAECETPRKNKFSNQTPTSSDKVENYLKKSKKILSPSNIGGMMNPIKNIIEIEAFNGFQYKLISQPTPDLQLSNCWSFMIASCSFFSLCATLYSENEEKDKTSFISGTYYSFGKMLFNGSYYFPKDFNFDSINYNLTYPSNDIRKSNFLIELNKRFDSMVAGIRIGATTVGLSLINYGEKGNIMGIESGFESSINKKYLKLGGIYRNNNYTICSSLSYNSPNPGIFTETGIKYSLDKNITMATSLNYNLEKSTSLASYGMRLRMFKSGELKGTITSEGKASAVLTHLIEKSILLKLSGDINFLKNSSIFNFGFSLHMGAL